MAKLIMHPAAQEASAAWVGTGNNLQTYGLVQASLKEYIPMVDKVHSDDIAAEHVALALIPHILVVERNQVHRLKVGLGSLLPRDFSL
jgi:hypothetical protein